MIYFTTSWDDGSEHDIRVSSLLNKYGVRGTFYIPKFFDNRATKFSSYNRILNKKEIKELSCHHEIGAHSINHISLDAVTVDDAKKEIIDSKKYIEGITDQPARIFCYPNGRYNEIILGIIKEAGYSGARTTQKMNINIPTNNFKIGVTMQCAPFPFRKINPKQYYWSRLLDPMRAYLYQIPKHPILFLNNKNWFEFAKNMFTYSYKTGDYFHLYGHSWEVEKYGLWNELELFLKNVAKHPNVKHVSNSDLVNLHHENIVC